MNKQSLGSHLALHRRGYLLAGLWASLWAGLLAGFFWYFRIESGLAKDDAAFDAMMKMPVSDSIQIRRFAAMYMLVPLSGMTAAGILILADTLLFLFHLDRNKLWFDAVKWSLSAWKAFLVWLAVILSICMAPFLIDLSEVFWISAVLCIILMIALPFMVWNKDYVVLEVPARFAKPQWPGSQPILLGATFIAISAPLLVIYGDAIEPALNIWLVFAIDLLQDIVMAISALLISYFWINRYKKYGISKLISLQNVGGFLSLNVMTGLWAAMIFVPPLACAMLIRFFLLPSIIQYKHLQFESYSVLQDLDGLASFGGTYWWLLITPAMFWLFIHAYGRLIFLLGLIESQENALKPGSQA